MKANVGGMDRSVRIVLGLILLPLAWFALSGGLAIVAYAVGGIALVTGLVRFCPVNAMLGIDTCHHEPGQAS